MAAHGKILTLDNLRKSRVIAVEWCCVCSKCFIVKRLINGCDLIYSRTRIEVFLVALAQQKVILSFEMNGRSLTFDARSPTPISNMSSFSLFSFFLLVNNSHTRET
jgi:tRNA 2-selenouridine synthase SelU